MREQLNYSPILSKKEWQHYGAAINTISTRFYTIPFITIPGKEQKKFSNEGIFITTGMHLEETSGPALLQSPKPLYPVLDPYVENGISFVLFPQINQFGTQFQRTSAPLHDSYLLRSDHRGIDYNDGFGLNNPARMTAESRAVERVMQDYMKSKSVLLGISLHEDSDIPGKGYIWTNGVRWPQRDTLRNALEERWGGTRYLAQHREHPTVPEEPEQSGRWEGPLAVEFQDEGCLEHWWASMCGIAAFCVEAPYGSHPKIKERFLLDSLEILLALQYG